MRTFLKLFCKINIFCILIVVASNHMLFPMKYKFFSFIALSVLVLGIGVVVMAASSQKFALIGSIQLPNAWSGSAARSVSFFS